MRTHFLQRRFKSAASLAIFVVSLAFPLLIHADDEFKGLPGLWKTTLLSSSSTSPASRLVTWHCVDEGADPWTNFAALPTPLDKSCKRTYSYRTSTSLKWRLDCTGSSTITDEGSVVFSAADHYAGKVELRGTLMGYPLDQTIVVEGKRYAACTSPQD
jgi:hypothetical protein